MFKVWSRLDIRKCTFSNMVVDKWNCLSVCCVNSSSANCFESICQ